jgi:divinyl protochlorophyllide a 8-vinyl-reductase
MSAVLELASARIGPNAVVRTIEALRERAGSGALGAVLDNAGLHRYRFAPPTEMVAQEEVVALYRALRESLSEELAREVADLAGRKTAAYLLAHRIPRPVQTLLRLLPARVSAPLLQSSIGRHTWTFAGSARVELQNGSPVRIMISGCPVCRGAHAVHPVCAYYGATFEELFRRLIAPKTVVRETSCEALGDDACAFEIAYAA